MLKNQQKKRKIMKTKMFNLNKSNHVKRSAFDLSHEKKVIRKDGSINAYI